MFNNTPISQNNVNPTLGNENSSENEQTTINLPAPAEICEEMPALPESSRISESLGQGACKWLDDYIAFSRLWSPRGYDGFHEACGLWLLSTVAARRVGADFGGQRHTGLYISLVSRSSMWAKTTTAKIAKEILNKANLQFLLVSDETTPQKFINDMTNRVPDNYNEKKPIDQKKLLQRIAQAGQRGWYYEEFGQHLAAMMREGGFMADFRGVLRRLDDGMDRYEYGTINRGSDVVENPYLALLANLTPFDLQKFAKRGSELWGDGFLPRFALVTPPEGRRNRGQFPMGEKIIPNDLINTLGEWNKRLGVPNVELTDILGPDKKPIGKQADVTPIKISLVEITKDINDAYYHYYDGLLDLSQAMPNHDMDGNYARFAEKALRIALLLASVGGCEKIEMRHWAKAQVITERWRTGLHVLYKQLNQPKESDSHEKEERIVTCLARKGKLTVRKISQQIGLSCLEINNMLSSLQESDIVASTRTGKSTEYYVIPEQV
jgi:hypothetical protein